MLTTSFGQTWTPIPFNVGNSTGSFTICDGAVTITVTDAFVLTNVTGDVDLNSSIDVFGSISFSEPLNIRVEDRTSNGSNNGDVWQITASSGGWTPFGSEASSSGSNLNLNLTSASNRSGGESTGPVNSLSISKMINGGAVILFYDLDICPVLLPIELLDFNVYPIEDEYVKLEWQTISEINNDFFTIERSIDGINWKELAKINGAGNSSSLLNYNLIDDKPLSGLSYYRLKQTDFNGKSEYFQIKSVTVKGVKNAQIEIYPNPANNQVTLLGNETELTQFKIYNTLGQDVTKFTSIIEKNKQKLVIDLSTLSAGSYYIKTKNNANILHKQ